ncbi:MAG: 1-deoxy-D-xylulose-5-phosphate synthase [Myxococcota bacterium]|nr:1-deoxy-D-xylulose-5-phosphate synthase [Myxococcota bacterium]
MSSIPVNPFAGKTGVAEMEALALRVREHIIRMSTGGGCFIGASLSCTDLMVYLYSKVLRLSPGDLQNPNRDYLLLSKGHDVPALYGALAELGYIPRERLAHHLKVTDQIYWHPNRFVPGIEFHSGSLGHLLSVAMGIATDIKLRGGQNRVFVILGDGECNEGSIWEGLLVASAKKLDNLVVVIDRNEFQANIRTEELIPLEPMEPKYQAFGCKVTRINGHDFSAMDAAFARLPVETGSPTVIIADTVRGKGLPSIEKRADRWFVNFTQNEVEQLLGELHGGKANLTSETLIVR